MAVVLAFLVRPRPGRWMVIAALVGTSALAVRAWRTSTPGAVRVANDAEGMSRLAALAQAVVPELQASAMRMAEAEIGTGPGRRHTAIEAMLPRQVLGEGAGVVLVDDRPVAWAGPIRIAIDSLTGETGVVSNSFYTVAWARATRGPRTAIAFRTLGVEAPAGQLSRPFTRAAAEVAGFPDVEVVDRPEGAVPLLAGSTTLAWLRPVAAQPAVARARGEAWGRAQVLLAVALVLVVMLVGGGGVRRRFVALVAAVGALWLAPLSTLSNVAPIFSAALYFSPLGGPFTASAGALALTGALGTLLALLVVRQVRWRPGVGARVVFMLVGAGVTAWLVEPLVRGVSLPQRGAGASQWFAWVLGLFLAVFPLVLVLVWGAARRGHRSGLGWTASAIAVVVASITPLVWTAGQGMPVWWHAAWFVALGALIAARWGPAAILHAAVVTGCGVTSLVWSTVTSQRIELAARDVAALTMPDVETQPLLERLYLRAQRNPPASARSELLKLYVGSELAAAGNPAELAIWDNDGLTDAPTAELVVAQLQRRVEGERGLVRAVVESGVPMLKDVPSRQGTQLVLAAPLAGGRVLSAVAAPRNQLAGDDPFAALVGLDIPSSGEPPYHLTLSVAGVRDTAAPAVWERREDEWHGDWRINAGGDNLFAHVEVELRPVDVLIARGVILVLASLALLGVMWVMLGAGDAAVRRLARWRVRRWWRSYRARLTLTLFGAFVLPSVAFGIWTLDRLRAEDLVSRSLLVQETLRAVRLSGPEALAAESERLQTPLFWYDGGVLTSTADALHLELAPLGRFLDPVAADEVVFGREEIASRRVTLGAIPTLVGYRAMGGGAVLAAPARRSELTLERQRGDVLALLFVALALGAGVAWGLSGLAAVAFAQPINALRRAADQVASGERELAALSSRPASEFAPVYDRFQAMAVELDDSRDALDATRRQTEAVLRDVASGVIALDRTARVVLSNPQAEALLGRALANGDRLSTDDANPLMARVLAFIGGTKDVAEFELTYRARDLRARLTRLTRGNGGVVLTLDDVTELGRAQRLFAWAEMARQVAHEIKNPLTPIRLGVQHLRRAHADQRPEFPQILERNVDRVLAEIDRLDEIARSFSRFGVRPGDLAPSEAVDLGRVAEDVVALERMGEATVDWQVAVPHDLTVRARDGELREVLLNVLENARLAGATRIELRATRAEGRAHVSVTDNGTGVSDDVLARAFEPRFSTRTSGSGLGLAISRRLVESWGGKIDLQRGPERGVVVTLTLDLAV